MKIHMDTYDRNSDRRLMSLCGIRITSVNSTVDDFEITCKRCNDDMRRIHRNNKIFMPDNYYEKTPANKKAMIAKILAEQAQGKGVEL